MLAPCEDQSPAGYTVYKLKARGSYSDLCARLGQECFEDVMKVDVLREHISQDLAHQMQSEGGKALLKSFVQQLQQFAEGLKPVPKRLRHVCHGMNFKDHTCRPSWAGGAFIFVTPLVANEIEDAFEIGELGKGDIVVSPEFQSDINEAMSIQIGVKPASYIHQASSKQVALGTFSAVDATIARSQATLLDPILQHELDMQLDSKALLEGADLFDEVSIRQVGIGASDSARLTHSTGSVPHDSRISWGHARTTVQRADQQGVSLGPTAYKNFTLKRHVPPSKLEQEKHVKVDANSLHQLEGQLPPCELTDSASECTALTTDTDLEDKELMTVPFADFMNTQFQNKQRPILKSAEAFGNYCSEQFDRFVPEVLEPFLQLVPIEGSLAKALNGEESSVLASLRLSFSALRKAALQTCKKRSLTQFFEASQSPKDNPVALEKAFEESTQLLVSELAKTIRLQLETVVDVKRLAVNKFLSGGVDIAGPHAGSEAMRSQFIHIAKEVLIKLDVRGAGHKAWQHQDAERKRKQKATDAASPAGSTDNRKALTGSTFKFSRRAANSDKKIAMQEADWTSVNGDAVKWSRSATTSGRGRGSTKGVKDEV